MYLNRGILAFLTLLVLLTKAVAVSEAAAGNAVKDMRVVEEGDQTRVFLILERLPRFAVAPLDADQTVVTFFDTIKPPRLDGSTSDTVGVAVAEKPQKGSFSLVFLRPLRELEFGWSPRRHLFLLTAFREKGEAPPSSSPSLENLRFGEWNEYSRMVMELSARPAWELINKGKEGVVIRLDGVRNHVKKTSFHPRKRLKRVVLVGGPQQLDVKISPAGPVANGRIFWLDAGQRLVMDFRDASGFPDNLELPPPPAGVTAIPPAPPPSVPDGSATAHSPDAIEPRTASADPAVQEMQAPEAGPPVPADRTATGGKPSPEGEISLSGGEDDTPSSGPLVRKKIIHAEKRRIKSKEAPAPEAVPPVDPHRNPPLVVTESRVEKVADPEALEADQALLYGKIREALKHKNAEAGSALVEEFLAKYPTSPLVERVSFHRGDFQFFLLEKGKKNVSSKVVEGYQCAVERFGSSEQAPHAYFNMAKAMEMTDNRYQAIVYLNLLISKYPESPILPLALLARGNLFLGSDSPEKGENDFKTLLVKYPDPELKQEARYGMARYLHGHKRCEEADQWLAEMDASGPGFWGKHPEALSLHAQNDLCLKKYAQARAWFFKAVNVGAQPESMDVLLTAIGDTYLKEADKEQAAKCYRAVMSGFPGSEGASMARLRLSTLSPKVQGTEEIPGQDDRLKAADPSELKLAKDFYQSGKYTDAMRFLRVLTESRDMQAEVRYLFVQAAQKEMDRLHRQGKLEEVIQLFKENESLLLGNIDPEHRLLLAKCLFQLKRYVEAISVYQQMSPVELAESKSGSLYELAQSYREGGDPERAVRLLEENRKTPESESERRKLTRLLADLYREANKRKEAFALYEELAKGNGLSDGENAEICLFMGEVLNDQGMPEKGREMLQRSLSLSEKDEKNKGVYLSALVQLGSGYEREKKQDEAIKCYEKAVDAGLGPEQKGYWRLKFRLADAYAEKGRKDEAKAIYKEILDEGDAELQSMAQIKLGSINLERQLMQLSIWSELGGRNRTDAKP